MTAAASGLRAACSANRSWTNRASCPGGSRSLDPDPSTVRTPAGAMSCHAAAMASRQACLDIAADCRRQPAGRSRDGLPQRVLPAVVDGDDKGVPRYISRIVRTVHECAFPSPMSRIVRAEKASLQVFLPVARLPDTRFSGPMSLVGGNS